MIENYKRALNINNKITRYARGGEKEKKYYGITFGDINFYKFLNSIGLTAAKSKTIQSVQVPREYFPDFLRGLFDGDGSFYVFRDKRWPNSFSFKISVASASINFINWLKSITTKYYGVKGYLHRGAEVWNLEYVKGDSKKFFSVIYHSPKILRLQRKYDKIRTAIEEDNKRGLSYLQKPRNAGVA